MARQSFRCISLSMLAVAVQLACFQLVTAADGKPLKVFILAGQSNMQGHAHVRTIDAMKLSEDTSALRKEMVDANGDPKTCKQVWISSIGSSPEEKTGRLSASYGAEPRGPKIGPEYTFGITMERELKEPILIIKTAWGGKSINTDFRSPSAGPYEFNETQLANFKKQGKDVATVKADKVKATGAYYRMMMEHIEIVLKDIKRVYPDYDAESGYELAGFVWFQGWNDMVDRGTYPTRDKPGGYGAYSTAMAHFIRDVRKDLKAPELPFVIGVLGVNGSTSKYGPDQRRYKGIHDNFRNAMAAPAELEEFRTNVKAVRTENFWDYEVSALRRKERALKPKLDTIRQSMKAKKVSRDEGQKAIDKIYAESFDAREITLLRESVSNAEFHYMGSARIMAKIGQGFAKATLELMKK